MMWSVVLVQVAKRELVEWDPSFLAGQSHQAHSIVRCMRLEDQCALTPLCPVQEHQFKSISWHGTGAARTLYKDDKALSV